MKQFMMQKGIFLTPDRLGKILAEYQTGLLPIFQRRWRYYEGRQSIINKIVEDDARPCNIIVCNFIKNIVDTYEGYAVGLPVSYSNPDEEARFEILQDILNYNDVQDEDSELFRNGLIFGRAAEICYIDEDKKVRFRTLDPREVIPVYDNTLNGDLIYAVRFWVDDLVENLTDTYMVEVYDEKYITKYRSSMNFSSFEFIEKVPHYFGQVPVTFFSLNKEEEGIADTVFSLQDAYNSLISDSIDDWDAFCDAYLVLKGAQADAEDLAAMKKYRTLILDQGDSAEYLTKATNTTEIEHLLETVESKIREMSACPNFASETFGTSSGIAIKYRCMAMENKTAGILNNFKKALQRRIELIAAINTLTDGEAMWRDVDIQFTRNIPVNQTEIATEINSLRGLVSDHTLLAQLPFINDVEAELELIEEEKQSSRLDLYDFSPVKEEENELLEDEMA